MKKVINIKCSCGKTNTSDQNFCPKCGAKIKVIKLFMVVFYPYRRQFSEQGEESIIIDIIVANDIDDAENISSLKSYNDLIKSLGFETDDPYRNKKEVYHYLDIEKPKDLENIIAKDEKAIIIKKISLDKLIQIKNSL